MEETVTETHAPETEVEVQKATDDAVVACKGLSKWYGDVVAVNDLDLDVRPGITGLLGPNGAGKTTLLRMLMGLVKPSAGTVRVLGEDPWDNAKLLARIGYVPDGDAPWQDRTGLDAVAFAGRLTGLDAATATSRARDALAKVGLGEAADRKVSAYSRGMRQRLKFAMALVHDPEILILDEPLIGTDPLTRRDLVELVKGLAESGKSVLLSTHVLPDVEAMTQRIVLMSHGRLLAHGEVGEIRDLLERYPRTVRLATSDPRGAGAALWRLPSVLSVQADEGAVVVRTRRPQEFFQELQDLLLAEDVPFTSVTTLDDDVESIFRYLVNER